MFRTTLPSEADTLWAEIERDFAEWEKYPVGMGSLYAVVAMCAERPIKIGFTEDLHGRVKTLQTGNPFLLRILGTIRGGKRTEEKIHRYLSADRLMGEWFASSPRTMGVVHRFKGDTAAGNLVLLSRHGKAA